MENIKNRWEEYENGRFIRSMLGKQAAPELLSPFGLTEDGLVDFRGVPVNESIHALRIQSVDFSNAKLLIRGQFVSNFNDCKFVKIKGGSLISKGFVGCDFSGASLREADLSGSFSSCKFDGARLIKPRMSGVSFLGCSFKNVSITSPKIYSTVFKDCEFSFLRIKRGEMTGTDFIGCSFDECEFDDVYLASNSGIGEGVKIINPFCP